MISERRPIGADPRIADLVRAGRVQVTLYPPQYAKNPATEELWAWTIELSCALSERIGMEFLRVEHSTRPSMRAQGAEPN